MPQEIIELRGHLIDSLILPRVLDLIMAHRGTFEVREIQVGRRSEDPTFARLAVTHRSARTLDTILAAVARYGAEPVERHPARLQPAPRDGVFPTGFYATTNLETSVFLNRRWLPVRHPEMDSGIRVSPSGRRAETVKMAAVRRGDLVVVGHEGVRVAPPESRLQPAAFQFMTSEVSTEKPKGVLIASVARAMRAERRAHRPILWVLGPAVVHTGAGGLFERLIKAGYVQVLFAGNALAAHDVESALFGTSLGVSVREGAIMRHGHENHLRAVNAIRAAGGLRQAVRKRLLTRGILCACVRRGVDVVLAGSIRDDGPLPEVITDTLKAQSAMRRRCRQVGLAIMVATLLHSVAAGNMLPARTRVVAVDIQQAAVTKLMDRGTFQTTGIVTDVQPFLAELVAELGA